MYSVSYYSELSPQMTTIMGIISLALAVVSYVAMWRVFEKADRPGWAALIPFYNAYTEFDIVYGNGWKFLLLLIPFYNIYVAIKFDIDFAHAYGQSTAFGVGLIFLSTIFTCILGFGSAEYEGDY